MSKHAKRVNIVQVKLVREKLKFITKIERSNHLKTLIN